MDEPVDVLCRSDVCGTSAKTYVKVRPSAVIAIVTEAGRSAIYFGCTIVKVDIPRGNELRGSINDEGYLAIFDKIPAEYVSRVPNK